MRAAFDVLWRVIPSDLPSRLRLALLAFACILVASNVPFIVTSGAAPWTRLALGALYLVVVLRWCAWTRGGWPAPSDLILELVALVGTSIVTIDPSNTASFLYAGVIIRAYYRSVRQLIWTLALYNVMFLVSVLVAPNVDHSLTAPNVLSQPPTAIVAAAVLYWFSRTVQTHHRLVGEQRLQVALQSELIAEVNASRHRFRSLVEALPGSILTSTPSGEIRYVSPQIDHILGVPAEELHTSWVTLIHQFVHPDDQARVFSLSSASLSTGAPCSIEFRARKPTGEIVWIQLDNVLVDDGSPDSPLWQTLAFDVTERHTLTEQLTHQAFHDPLTGLPNRLRFNERVDAALDRCALDGSVPAVCFIDLDNFKTVNDTLGHLLGDRLVIEVAQRLRRSLRQDDIVARLGGDEFALLLEAPKGQAEIIRVVNRVVADLSQPFVLDGHPVFTSASVGIAIADRPGIGRTELIRRADVAMYAAKGGGKGRYATFDPLMNSRAFQRMDLDRDLRHALEHDELRIVYQPIVHLSTRTIHGVEALIRWQHPVRGLISPEDFLTVMEETGLIVNVGRWMLETACRQISEWQRSVPGATGLRLSLNLSPRQLQDPDLVNAITHALAGSGLDPRHLQLEISESTMLRDVEHASQSVADLIDLGVRIAIDDFGTGNSSLGHLRQLPVHMLKIDRTYVADYGRSEQGTTMLRAMVTLGKTLGMDVTAEGIETIEQTALRTIGCDYGQGFYFARPLPDEEMHSLLCDGVVFPMIDSQPAIAAVPTDTLDRRQVG